MTNSRIEEDVLALRDTMERLAHDYRATIMELSNRSPRQLARFRALADAYQAFSDDLDDIVARNRASAIASEQDHGKTPVEAAKDAALVAAAAAEAGKTCAAAAKSYGSSPTPKHWYLFARQAHHPDLGAGLVFETWRPSLPGNASAPEALFVYRGQQSTMVAQTNLDNLALLPAVLTSAEDYESAPVGTIISGAVETGEEQGPSPEDIAQDSISYGRHLLEKWEDGYWHARLSKCSSRKLANETRKVIRYGNQ